MTFAFALQKLPFFHGNRDTEMSERQFFRIKPSLFVRFRQYINSITHFHFFFNIFYRFYLHLYKIFFFARRLTRFEKNDIITA